MQQQGGDASADNEVMSILSSPVRQKNFVVKPQPRAGGHAVTGSGGLCPPSPGANGQCLPGSAAAADSYLQNSSSSALVGGVVGVGGGGGGVGGGCRGVEAGLLGGGSVVDPGRLANGPSPPHTPGLPKSTSASWDPQVQSSSSAFSVPAGRGIGGGGGGRGEGPGGTGGVGMGSAGFGGLGLGGFSSSGGDHRDFQVRLG